MTATHTFDRSFSDAGRWDAPFDDLLAPMSLAAFIERHWGRAPLYVSGAEHRSRFDGLCSADTLRDLLRAQPIAVKAAYRDLRGEHAEMRVDPREAMRHFDAGMTLCLESVHRYIEPLGRLLSACKLHLGDPGYPVINCYYSPAGKGFGLHYDYVHVFILQIEGEKEWHVSKTPALDHPHENLLARDRERFNATHPWAQIAPPSDEGLATHVLRPGDVLYMPPGTWHRASAFGGSLGLTMSFRPLFFADYVADRLRDRLAGAAGWRSGVPLLPADGDGAPPPVIASYFAEHKAQLARLLDGLTPEDFLTYALERHREVPLVPERAAALLRVDAGGYSRISRFPIRVVAAGGPESSDRLLFHKQSRARVPRAVAALAQRLAALESFSRAEAVAMGATENLDPAEVDAVLALLIRIEAISAS
jgi:ribosomal protein L16 Arg81 hydroxylase